MTGSNKGVNRNKVYTEIFLLCHMVYMLHRGKSFYITKNVKIILVTKDNRKKHFLRVLNYKASWKKQEIVTKMVTVYSMLLLAEFINRMFNDLALNWQSTV